MKKLYSFLLALLLCASASAQVTLTIDGQKVADGATHTQVYAVEAFDKIPGMPFLGQNYGFYPEIEIASQKAQDIVVTVIDKTQDAGTQFCFGGTCDELYKKGYQSNKVVTMEAGKAQNMLVHVVHQEAATAPYQVELMIDAYGTLDNSRVTSTIILKYDPNAAHVSGPEAVEAAGAYYTLSGVRVDNPAPGLYIRGGRKVVVH